MYSIHQLCKTQADLGHEIVVATTNVDVDGRLSVSTNQGCVIDGVSVWYFSVGKFFEKLCYSNSLRIWIKKNIKTFDLVHIHSVYLFPTIYTLLQAKLFGVKVVLSPRGMIEKKLIRARNYLYKTSYLALLKFFAGNIHFIHATSTKEKREIQNFFASPQVVVIPNGYTPIVLPQRKWYRTDIDLLYIGRLSSKKRLHLLLEALAFVPTARACLAGPSERGCREQLHSLAMRIGVYQRIEWHDYVNEDQKRTLFSRSKLFILCSENENFGNVVLESYTHAVPVALTVGVGLSDWVARHQVGWVLPENPKDMGAFLKIKITQIDELRRHGLKGQARLSLDFSWNSISKTFIEHYQYHD